MPTTDNRPDSTSGGFYIWYDGSRYDWYIKQPADVSPLTRAAERFIEMFR
jgi:hypothetical protein